MDALCRTVRVLLVEDDDYDALETARALRAAPGPVQVHRVPSAEEALAWIAEHDAPHLICVDEALPGIQGAELRDRLRDDPRCWGAIVVPITGHRTPEHGPACIDKPPTRELLARLVLQVRAQWHLTALALALWAGR